MSKVLKVSFGNLKSQRHGFYEARIDQWDKRPLNNNKNNANPHHHKTSRCAAVKKGLRQDGKINDEQFQLFTAVRRC